jgi:hypothetical protein
MSSSRPNATLVALNKKVRKLKSDVKAINTTSADASSAVVTQKSAIDRLERENELLRQVRDHSVISNVFTGQSYNMLCNI